MKDQSSSPYTEEPIDRPGTPRAASWSYSSASVSSPHTHTKSEGRCGRVSAPIGHTLLTVFFADHGTKDSVLANIAAMREWAIARTVENIRIPQLPRR